MKKLYVGFSRPRTWKPFSWLIRVFEGEGIRLCPFSHVYIKFFSETYQRWFYYQASGLVVNFEAKERFEAHNLTVELYELDVADADMIAAVQFCVDRLGLPYGLKQVFGIAWVYLNRRIAGRIVANPFADGEATEVCSEIGARLLKEARGVAFKGVDFDIIGPRHLRDLIKPLPFAHEVQP